ncbi:hypothetical protein ACSXAY_11540 [Clostridium perfringens]
MSVKEVTIEEHIGFVKKIYKDFILIELKNYNVCLNKADLIENVGFKLQVRRANEWIEVGKEVFTDLKLLDGPKVREAYHNFRKMSIRRV